jgi:predicted dehydrogenase
MKLGIIGLKDFDNGHPFSFSAIINGYNEKEFKKTKYKGILKYLKLKPKKNFGIKNVKITHAWTQDEKITKILCSACKIQHAIKNYKDMIGEIDALIIARDDKHFSISKLFLKKGVPVFIDKPLTSKISELKFFKKYLYSGMLMSTSGLRFASETGYLKKKIKEIGKIKTVTARVVNDLFKYGIHMLDVLDELNILNVNKIVRNKKNVDKVTFFCKANILVNLICLGKVKKIFSIHIIGEKKSVKIDFEDNFIAFRNTLKTFIKMVKLKKPVINPSRTLNVINLLITTMKLKNDKIHRFKR